MGLWHRLTRAADDGLDARVAVIGAGFVGRNVVARLAATPGMRPALVVNRTVEAGRQAYALAGFDPAVVLVSDDPEALAVALADRRPAVAPIPGVLRALDLDVAVEATGAVGYGALAALDALESGTHVVTMNAEADVTLGALLARTAAANGTVYTIADGDQPGVLLRLAEEVTGMGFEVVAALNCKRHLDTHQTPATGASYGTRDGTSSVVTTSAGDGTKMNIENATVANATGLLPERRGMHGVATDRDHVVEDVLASLSTRSAVDYTLGGDFGAGVLVIGHAQLSDSESAALRYYKMGSGPHYAFYRPYHLVHLEVAVSIAEVVLDGDRLGAPVERPVAEVVTLAKRDLAPGDALDGIGGFDCYGQIDTVERASGLLPIGLADHARVVRAVPRDEPVPLDAVEIDADADAVRLRARQDQLLAGG